MGLFYDRSSKKIVDNLLTWFNDPEVAIYSMVRPPIMEIVVEQWIDAWGTDKDEVVFGIVPNGFQNIFGIVGLHRINWIDRNAELGVIIGESTDRRKGYGREATRTLIDYAFKELNLHRLRARVSAFNAPAMKLADKIGLAIEGTEKEAVFHEGKYFDLHIFGLLRKNWKK